MTTLDAPVVTRMKKPGNSAVERVLVTLEREHLVAAFAEWNRRVEADPDGFVEPESGLEADSADYLIELLSEQAAQVDAADGAL